MKTDFDALPGWYRYRQVRGQLGMLFHFEGSLWFAFDGTTLFVRIGAPGKQNARWCVA